SAARDPVGCAVSWGDDLDLLRGRHRHMEPRARDALDESVGGPCALLELQLPPLDLQIVAPRVQSLELDEERPRAMLAVDRSGGGAERRQPQQRHGNRERPGETALELPELVVDEHAQRLKGARRRMLAGLARAHRGGDERGELTGAAERLLPPRRDDRLRHAAREPLFSESRDHLTYLVDARASEPRRNGFA